MKREKRRIVVVGFSFGALELVFMLVRSFFLNAQVTVIAPQMRFAFIPNSIFVPFGRSWKSITLNLRPILWLLGVKMVMDKVASVNPNCSKVKTASDEFYEYDELILAVGAKQHPELIPGLAENGCILGNKAGSEKLWQQLKALKLSSSSNGGEGRNIILLNPGGNGCSGPIYELAFMVRNWSNKNGLQNASVQIVTSERSLIQTFGSDVHNHCEQILSQRNISYHLDSQATGIHDGTIYLNGPCDISYDVLISLAPQRGPAYLGLPVNDNGFIKVNPDSLQVLGLSNVYAVGDCNNIPLNQGYMAMLQANVVADNLIAKIRGRKAQKRFSDTMEAMCIMYMGSSAFAGRIPLLLNEAGTLEIDYRRSERYYLGMGKIWQYSKHLLGFAIMACFALGVCYHGGFVWKLVCGPCLEFLLKNFANKMHPRRDSEDVMSSD